jgi:sugar phosphate permease
MSVEGGETEQRAPLYSWYALGVLFAVYLANFVDRQILSILANDIKADLALTDAELGFLYGTSFAIFYALFGIPLGRLADSWSRTRLLALGLTLWSLMTALSGFARSGAALAAARVGVGVGEATASPCAYSLISDWFPQRLRGTAIGIYSGGLFVGSGLSLLISAWPAGRRRFSRLACRASCWPFGCCLCASRRAAGSTGSQARAIPTPGAFSSVRSH